MATYNPSSSIFEAIEFISQLKGRINVAHRSFQLNESQALHSLYHGAEVTKFETVIYVDFDYEGNQPIASKSFGWIGDFCETGLIKRELAKLGF